MRHLKWCFGLLLIWPTENVPLALKNAWAVFSPELAVTENTGRLKDGKYQPRGNQQGKKGMKIRISTVLCIRQLGMINKLPSSSSEV